MKIQAITRPLRSVIDIIIHAFSIVFFVSLLPGLTAHAAAPVVENQIPNQVAYNGQAFGMSFDTLHVFSDADGDILSVNVKLTDGSNLPGWLILTAIDIPLLVGTYDTTGSAFEVAVAGNYAYVADGLSGLQIIDISTPSSPSLVGTYDTTNSVCNICV